jgi:uncharacterized protein YicC (UPF0701 family)
LDVELNEAFLEALGGALERAREQGISGSMTPGDLLRFPRALSIRERDQPRKKPSKSEHASRRRWRLRLTSSTRCAFGKADICGPTWRPGGRPASFSSVPRAAKRGWPGCRFACRSGARAQADALADEAAIAQEIAKFVGRSDITEEVVRFRRHLEHWRALSESPEPCGRKLDFLLRK